MGTCWQRSLASCEECNPDASDIVVADIIARVWAWLSGLQKARIFCAQSFLLIRMFVPVVPRQP